MMPRPDTPGPMRRRGPRPLALHLTLGTPNSNSSAPGSPSWSTPPAGLDPAVVAGIAAYRRHPYQRDLPDPPAIWQEGDSRLLDYGGAGPTVLVVPSLINRAYVLDLALGRSMLRHLAAGGVRPVLLDWGWPGPQERHFTLTDYIAGRLDRALSAIAGPVTLMGYCMGGLLTLALALRRPDVVRSLVLLATPWQFDAGLPGVTPGSMAGGTLPVDALQTAFAMLEPGAVAAKYRSFGALDQAGERARMFVAIEDWLADGVPLAGPVAAECLSGWYGGNLPVQGKWLVAGQPVLPGTLHCPVLLAIPAQDHIVPPASAQALAAQLPASTVLTPGAGHVGMVVGARARAQLWDPVLDWLRTH